MKPALPLWAAQIEPLNMGEAARVLGMSRRKLSDEIRTHPYYERRGTRKVFYPEHIDALRREISQCQVSGSLKEAASTTPPEPLPGSALEEALALVTDGTLKNSGHSMKPCFSNVVHMARRRSVHSRKRS